MRQTRFACMAHRTIGKLDDSIHTPKFPGILSDRGDFVREPHVLDDNMLAIDQRVIDATFPGANPDRWPNDLAAPLSTECLHPVAGGSPTQKRRRLLLFVAFDLRLAQPEHAHHVLQRVRHPDSRVPVLAL